MKTTPAAQLANFVNASVTMFFHSVQRLTAAPSRGGVPRGRNRALCLRARPAVSIPPRPCSFGPPMPWRSRARGRAPRTVPGASAGVDGSAVRHSPPIFGIKGKNRSHAAWLGACRRRRSRRPRGVVHRGIGLGGRRPRLGGGARDGRTPIRSRRGPYRNRPHSGLVGKTLDGGGRVFAPRSAKSR